MMKVTCEGCDGKGCKGYEVGRVYVMHPCIVCRGRGYAICLTKGDMFMGIGMTVIACAMVAALVYFWVIVGGAT